MRKVGKAMMVLLAACVISVTTFFVVQGTSSPTATRSYGTVSDVSQSPVAGASNAGRESASSLSVDRGFRRGGSFDLIGGLLGMLGNLVLFSLVVMGVI